MLQDSASGKQRRGLRRCRERGLSGIRSRKFHHFCTGIWRLHYKSKLDEEIIMKQFWSFQLRMDLPDQMQVECNQQTGSRRLRWLRRQQLRFRIPRYPARTGECWRHGFYRVFPADRLCSGRLLRRRRLPQKWLHTTTVNQQSDTHKTITNILALGSAVKAVSIALLIDWNIFMRWVSPDEMKKEWDRIVIYILIYLTLWCWYCIWNEGEMRKALCRPQRIIDSQTEI